MARVLVTGANGHVGANVVRSLLRHGYEVVPLVRRSADTRSIDGLGLHCRYGDIMDRESLVAAARGCDAIIHTAAVFVFWAKNPDTIVQPALAGTRNILYAAQAAGVRRLVYTSSSFAIGLSDHPNETRCEDHWNNDPRNPYLVAKTLSEREALRLAEELGVPTVRLCPGSVLGPYDYRVTPSMDLLAEVIVNNGVYYNGGLNFVDARDVAEIHVRAIETGEPGQRYAAGGTNLHLRDLAALVAQYTGITAKPLPGGRRTALLAGSLFDLVSAVTGRKPFFSRSEAFECVGRYNYLDSSLAQRTFGITPRPIAETVHDALRWLVHINAIKARLTPPHADNLLPDPTW